MTKRNGFMHPDEVLERARISEAKQSSDLHPLIGSAATAEDLIENDHPDVQAWLAPNRRATTYCDSCGHVGDHAHDCPQQLAIEAQREQRREDALDRIERAESIVGLFRTFGATLLRRLAKKLEP